MLLVVVSQFLDVLSARRPNCANLSPLGATSVAFQDEIRNRFVALYGGYDISTVTYIIRSVFFIYLSICNLLIQSPSV